jgi:adenine-specific DNA-methyltransferase
MIESGAFERAESYENESALDYAIRLSRIWANSKKIEERKARAQFFTPREISSFMANMFTIEKENFRLLDPGAGVGNLTAAFCDRLMKHPVKCAVFVDAYESDPELIPALESVLDVCKKQLSDHGHSFAYNISADDFVISNREILEDQSLSRFENDRFFDYIISNPPYYKLDKSSPQALVMRKFISGHPNIYALFMVLSARMLNEDGELVFITPRSFCSGMYYQKFRKWFLQTVRISRMHTFESRRDIFDTDGVLQENILIKAIKSRANQEIVRISSSKSKLFDAFREITATKNEIEFHKNGDVFIRIPSSSRDVATLKLIDAWPETLRNLGLEISTGPVVVFRTKESVIHENEATAKFVPLLWMHNLEDMKVKWPVRWKNKPTGIYVNKNTERLLLPVQNYVLVGRFSFKEQKKRLQVAVLVKEDFPFDVIGIENHVNYIHKTDGELTTEEALGIAALLSTYLVDSYFRSLNGNTQVNAVDLRSLPLPSIGQIREIGKRRFQSQENYIDWDKLVCEVLHVSASSSEDHGGEMLIEQD